VQAPAAPPRCEPLPRARDPLLLLLLLLKLLLLLLLVQPLLPPLPSLRLSRAQRPRLLAREQQLPLLLVRRPVRPLQRAAPAEPHLRLAGRCEGDRRQILMLPAALALAAAACLAAPAAARGDGLTQARPLLQLIRVGRGPRLKLQQRLAQHRSNVAPNLGLVLARLVAPALMEAAINCCNACSTALGLCHGNSQHGVEQHSAAKRSPTSRVQPA
jgi:hypothetical protein